MACARKRLWMLFAWSLLPLVQWSSELHDVHRDFLGCKSALPVQLSSSFARCMQASKHRQLERAPRSSAAADGSVSTGDLALAALFLAFCAAYLPALLGVKGAAARVGGFRYLANRGKSGWSDACHLLAAKHPEYSGDSVFTYFDEFGGARLPELGDHSRLVQLIGRSGTDVYDHKRGLALRLREAGCDDAFARTFLSADEALEGTEPGALLYAKPPEESGGKGIKVLRREELQGLPQGYIFQEAVRDIELIEGRKFVIRFYFLVHNQCLYLHRRAVIIVHGLPYDRDSTDLAVQVRHDWFRASSDPTGPADPASASAYLLLLHEAAEGPRWSAAIGRSLKAAREALRPLLEASDEDHYTLVGGDALIDTDGEARLIELNMYPNLYSENDMVDKKVYVPMMEDILAMILLSEQREEAELVLNLRE